MSGNGPGNNNTPNDVPDVPKDRPTDDVDFVNLHNLPLPHKYSDYKEAYEWILDFVDKGVVTVTSDITTIPVSERQGRVILVPGPDVTDPISLYIDGTEYTLGGGQGIVEHIGDLDLLSGDTDNQQEDDIIEIADRTGTTLTMQGGEYTNALLNTADIEDSQFIRGVAEPDRLILPIVPVSGTDFEITNLTATDDVPGGSSTITATVTNNGAAGLGTVTLTSSDTSDPGNVSVGPISPGVTETVSTDGNLPGSDGDCTTFKGEINGTSQTDTACATAAPADLEITNLTATDGPPGGQSDITVEVTNNGDVDGSGTVTFESSYTLFPVIEDPGDVSVGPISGGDTETVTQTGDLRFEEGKCLTLTGEINGTSAQSQACAKGLRVTNLTATDAPSDSDSDITVEVTNNGDSSRSGTVTLTSTDTSNPTNVTFTGINPDDTVTKTTTGNLPSSAGDCTTFKGEINLISQSDTACATAAPDLAVTDLTATDGSPDGDSDITVEVTNNGSASGGGIVTLTSTNTSDPTNVTFTGINWDDTVTKTRTGNLPSSAGNCTTFKGEINGTSKQSQACAESPGLVITNLTASGGPPSGDSTIMVEVTNNTGSSKSGTVTLTSTNTSNPSDVTFSGINSGNTVSKTTSGNLPGSDGSCTTFKGVINGTSEQSEACADAGPANLHVISLAAEPDCCTIGGRTDLKPQVKNEGGTAGSGTVTFSSDDTNDLPSNIDTGSVAPGQLITPTASDDAQFPTKASTTWTYGAEMQSNVGDPEKTTATSSTPPNLQVIDITADPSSGTPSTNIDLNVTVKNTGGGYASGEVTFSSNDATDNAVPDNVATGPGDIGSGSTEIVTASAILPKSPNTDWTYEAKMKDESGDPDESVTVSSNSNTGPNLQVTNITANPMEGPPGSQTDLTVTVENVGGGDGWGTVVFSSDDTGNVPGNADTGTIGAGNQTDITRIADLPDISNEDWTYEAEMQGAGGTPDESVTVSSYSPDLEVTALSATPSSGPANGKTDLTATVKNKGQANGDGTLTFSSTNTSDVPPNKDITNLGVNDTKTVTYRGNYIPATPDTTWTYEAEIQSSTATPASTTVSSAKDNADLTIKSMSATNGSAGGTSTISVTVKNPTSSDATGSGTVTITSSEPTDPGDPSVGPISPGGTETVSTTGELPSMVGCTTFDAEIHGSTKSADGCVNGGPAP